MGIEGRKGGIWEVWNSKEKAGFSGDREVGDELKVEYDGLGDAFEEPRRRGR